MLAFGKRQDYFATENTSSTFGVPVRRVTSRTRNAPTHKRHRSGSITKSKLMIQNAGPFGRARVGAQLGASLEPSEVYPTPDGTSPEATDRNSARFTLPIVWTMAAAAATAVASAQVINSSEHDYRSFPIIIFTLYERESRNSVILHRGPQLRRIRVLDRDLITETCRAKAIGAFDVRSNRRKRITPARLLLVLCAASKICAASPADFVRDVAR